MLITLAVGPPQYSGILRSTGIAISFAIAATNGGIVHSANSIWINLAFINTWLFFGASGCRNYDNGDYQNYSHLYLFTS